MNRGRVVIATVAVLGLSMGVAAPGASGQELPVSVEASGPARVVANTEEPTGRMVATFTVTDPTLTASGATICRDYAEKQRKACRYLRFDGQDVSDDWDDDFYYDEDDDYIRWDIAGAPGRWTIQYPIGYDEISREECVAAAWNDDSRFAAVIDVQNDAGTVIGQGSWEYDVQCTGIVGGVLGPDKTRVYASRNSQSKPFDFIVLDEDRVLSSYRVCRYDAISGRYRGCDREDLTKRNRMDTGWGVSYSLTWKPLGSSLCDYIDRKWPQAGFRVQFYDKDMKKRLQLYRGTQLRC